MGLRSFLERVVGSQPAGQVDAPLERALVQPIYRQGGIRQGITATEQQPTAARLVTHGFRSTQATAARAVGARVSDLSFMMQRRERTEDGSRQWVDQPEHRFLETLERPNVLHSRRQLLKLTSYWLTQTGEAFWLIVTNGAGSVRELWPMSPRHIEKLSSPAEPVSGFIFHGEGGETRYSLDEVVWIFDPDPADPFGGVGVVGPQAVDFDSNTFARETMRSHYKNDATPKIVLKGGPEASAPNETEKKAFWANWTNNFNTRGGEHQGVPAFIPTDWDAIQLASSGVGDSVALLEYLQNQFFMANGVPRSILGDVVDANRAAADTNRLVFDRHTIKPQTGLIADALTQQIVVPEYGREWRCIFEDFISEDDEIRLREEEQDLNLKVRSVNQVRADRGLDPVDWGDDPIGNFGDIPYTGESDDDPFPDGDDGDDEPTGEETQTGGAEDNAAADAEDDDTEPAQRARPSQSARFTPEAAWSRFAQSEATYVPRMVSAARRVFAGQKRLALEAFAAQGGDVPGATARVYSRADWIDDLFALEDFQRLFDVLITPITLEVYEKAGANILQSLGERPTLDFTDAAAKHLRENGAQLVTYANQTTKRNLRNTIAKGVDQGESFDDIAKRVRGVFNAASKSRARTIARTEVGHAITQGQLAGYKQSKVVTLKRWHTALDERVRDSHEIDGQTVRVDEPFVLGDGELAQGPRVAADGGRLSARNSINCRCFTTPILEGV